MKKVILLYSILLLSFISFSQTKMTFSLMRAINESPEITSITIYVKGDLEAIKKYIAPFSGKYKHTFKQYHAIDVPTKEVANLLQQPFIKDLEFTYSKPILLMDTSLKKNNILPVHAGTFPLPHPYTGKGVLVGIIDSGIDYQHPDFWDSTGTSKVLYIWDQADTASSFSPTNYTYGREWNTYEISNNIATHRDNPSYSGHGTNVSGIVASSGMATGKFKGGAPDAQLVVVASNYSSNNWLSDVGDAMDYIYAKADELGMPCVINISAGTYIGSHDGLDIDAQRIDSIVKAKNGRALVCAAGNAGAIDAYHLGYDVTTDTSFTWYEFNSALNYFGPYSPNGAVYMELYADTADFNNVQFSIGADLITPTYQNRGNSPFINVQGLFDGSYNIDGNGIYNGVISNSNGDKIADVYMGFDLINDNRTYMLQVIVDPDSITNYAYRLSTTGNGHFDSWGTSSGIMGISDITAIIPDSADFPEIVNYQLPDTTQSIVSSFTCLPDIITVGNYANKTKYPTIENPNQVVDASDESISYTSSMGPNRLGDIKPTIAGPGTATTTASSLYILSILAVANKTKIDPDSLHSLAGGTSMASPSVAGVVALLFEKCSNYSSIDIKNMLINSAKKDSLTGDSPNNVYGYGKADAYQAFLQQSFAIPLNYTGTKEVCEEDVVKTLELFPEYYWSNGSNASQILVNQGGGYYAAVIDTAGCMQLTDSVNIVINPFLIPSPSLGQNDTTLCETDSVTLQSSGSYFKYLWNNGANTVALTTNQSGTYHVVVTDFDGCKAISNSVNLIFLIAPPTPNVTVLNDTILNSGIANAYQWYYSDFPLIGDTLQTLYAQDSGYYYVSIQNSNGCAAISDSVFITLPKTTVGLQEKEAYSIAIYPNPFTGEVNVEVPPIGNYTIGIYNELGQRVFFSRNNTLTNSITHKLDMRNITKGIYILKIEGEKDSFQQKIIKQ